MCSACCTLVGAPRTARSRCPLTPNVSSSVVFRMPARANAHNWQCTYPPPPLAPRSYQMDLPK
eukprot:10118561-Alexandrium_andersonii.AAC.1